MYYKKPLQAALLAVLVSGLAGIATRAEVIEQVLVKVNGEIFTKTDLESRQVSALRQMGVSDGMKRHRARHRPSPEGVHGGTNGEVSWLRAFARLPGDPVAS